MNILLLALSPYSLGRTAQMPRARERSTLDLAMSQCPGILEDSHVCEVKDLSSGTGAGWHSGAQPCMGPLVTHDDH